MILLESRLSWFVFAIFVLGVLSCGEQVQEPEKKIRIAVAGFSHETCTFCPNPTTVESYERGGVHYGDEVIEAYRGVQIYINGYIKVAEQEEDVELVGIADASSSWGGSSGSWITAEAFDKYTGEIVAGLKDKGPFDGVLLALHGAMAAENHPIILMGNHYHIPFHSAISFNRVHFGHQVSIPDS